MYSLTWDKCYENKLNEHDFPLKQINHHWLGQVSEYCLLGSCMNSWWWSRPALRKEGFLVSLLQTAFTPLGRHVSRAKYFSSFSPVPFFSPFTPPCWEFSAFLPLWCCGCGGHSRPADWLSPAIEVAGYLRVGPTRPLGSFCHPESLRSLSTCSSCLNIPRLVCFWVESPWPGGLRGGL